RVQAVLPLGAGFAVVPDNSWRAMQAREAVRAEWTPGPENSLDDGALWRRFARLIETEGKTTHVVGDADRLIGSAARVITAEYRLPFLAHATRSEERRVGESGARG